MSSWQTIAGAAGRNNRPAILFEAWQFGEFRSVDELAVGIEDAWTSAEFPEQCLSRRHWLEMFLQVGYVEEHRRAMRPSDSVTLYRGAVNGRRNGMAWTRDLERAAWFSRRFGDGGCLWETVAPSAYLLAHFKESRGEDEFVLNTKRLRIQQLAQ